jgi:hypothetical protein
MKSSMKSRRAAQRSSRTAVAAALFGLDDQTGTAGRPRREEVLSICVHLHRLDDLLAAGCPQSDVNLLHGLPGRRVS